MIIELTDSLNYINIRPSANAIPIKVGFNNDDANGTIRIAWYAREQNKFMYTDIQISQDGIIQRKDIF